MLGLSLFNYDAERRGANGPAELSGLRFLFSIFPSRFFIAGAAIVWKYPITEARHREIREELERRGEGIAERTV